MRVNRIVCPKCQTSLTSKAGVEAGTSIACPKCKHKFAVAAPPEEEEVVDDFDFVDDDEGEAPKKKPAKPAAKKPVADDEDEAPKKKPLKPAPKKTIEPDEEEDEDEKPKPKRRPRDEEDDEEDEKPRPKKRQAEDDEEDERPRAKKGKRDEDDDDNRPRKKKKKRRGDDEELGVYGKLKANIWVRVSVLGVLLAILGVVIYLRFVKDKNESSSDSKQPPQQEEDYSKPITRDQLGKYPKVTPKKPVDELSKFQGTWNASRVTANGQEAPADELRKIGFTVQGDQFTPHDNPNDPAKCKVDPSKTPAEIDFIDTKKETARAIYRFGPGDTLELCMNPKTGGERPRDFSTPKGSPNVLIVLKRSAK